MCLTLFFKGEGWFLTPEEREEQRNKLIVPLIAKRDKVVYKVLTMNNKSPYKNFQYEKGTHYYNEGEKPFGIESFNSRLEIYDGLHSYNSKVDAVGNWEYELERKQVKIVKMYIPKGSKYYTNGKETVSDNIIWY